MDLPMACFVAVPGVLGLYCIAAGIWRDLPMLKGRGPGLEKFVGEDAARIISLVVGAVMVLLALSVLFASIR